MPHDHPHIRGSIFLPLFRVFSAACFFACAVFMPQAGGASETPQPVPTRITSERMQYDAANQRVIFEGKVHVIRPDFQLWSEKLTVMLEKETKQDKHKRQGNGTVSPAMGMEAGQVERIIAERNVRMQQEDKSGTCGKATYIAADGKIIMEQNPVVNDGPNQIRGQIINYYTRDNRSEVIGSVDVRFVTDDKGETHSPLSGKPKNPEANGQPRKGLKVGGGVSNKGRQ